MAAMKRIVIRADASSQIGSGHVMRCLTLADALRDAGAEDISFVCREDVGNYIKFIQSQGFAVSPIEDAAADVPVEAASAERPADWLVVDHYGLDAAWETRARSLSRHIMVIDDLADRKHDCDILLDQNFVRSMQTRYDGLVPDSCRRLLGPAHTLLRKEFSSVTARPRDGSVRRILVFFGGSDPRGLTLKTVVTLGRMPAGPTVGVVVGLAHQDKDALEAECHRYGFTLHVQTDHMASLLDAADLVIGGGGTTTWERCKLGVPSITVVMADNQRGITEAVAAEGATVNLGEADDVGPDNLKEAIQNLMKNPESVRAMSERALALMKGDSSGVDSVVRAMAAIETGRPA